MEWAGYAALIRMAEVAGDAETADLGRSIQAEERTMMERLERDFDGAEQASHRDVPPGDLPRHVREHLAEAHALNAQSAKLLEQGEKASGDDALAQVYSRSVADSRSHLKLIEDRLSSLGENRSVVEDAALRLGALNWSLFIRAQQDTPCKLLAFAYAVEHLVIGGIELLMRTARRAGDLDTERLCQCLIEGKRAIALRLAEAVDASVQVTLQEVAHVSEKRKAG